MQQRYGTPSIGEEVKVSRILKFQGDLIELVYNRNL